MDNYDSPSVFIIIVNWNNCSDTVECIKSLLRTRYKNKKIIVIDNGSTDGSVEYLSEWIKDNRCGDLLTIIPLKENTGFGGANNKGIRHALENNADFILLINNDTVTTEDFLDELIKTAITNRRIGILGCRIHYYKDKSKVWFSGGKIDFLRGAFYHDEVLCSGLRESDFITGCLMHIPSSVFRIAGLFDETYFLNVEDIDFSWRVKKAGYVLMLDCDAIIYHKVSASIGGLYSAKNQNYFHRNRMIFFKKILPGYSYIIFIVFQFFIAIPVWCLIQSFNRRFGVIKSALRGYLDYLKGIGGKGCYS